MSLFNILLCNAMYCTVLYCTLLRVVNKVLRGLKNSTCMIQVGDV